MNDLSTDALLDRVISLERDARRFKLFSAATILVLIAVTAIGASAVSRTAAPFTVTQNGSTRVRLDADGMHIYDGGGKQRIFIGFNSHSQPSIHLNDSSGTTRQSIYLDPKSSAGIDQIDRRGNVIASYYVGDTDNFARIDLQGSDGKDRFYVRADNTPFLSFGDASYNNREVVGLTTEGSGLLRMKDRSGNNVISLEGQDSGPFIRISANNTERAYLGVYTNGNSGLVFQNTEGTQTGSYP